MNSELPDELDRLYAKMEWESPRPNMSALVMQRVRAMQRVQRVSSILSLVALAALGLFAFALGRGLTFGGTLDYLAVLTSNMDVALESADDFLLALQAVVPWLEIGAVLAGALLLWLTSIVLPRIWSGRRPKLS